MSFSFINNNPYKSCQSYNPNTTYTNNSYDNSFNYSPLIPNKSSTNKIYCDNGINYNNNQSNLALKGYELQETELSKIFFSKENIKRIQKKIKNEIYNRSKGQYILEDEQNENDLLIAMRAVYLQNAKHVPKYIIKQVKILNKNVVDYVVPDMITNIKQYYGYLRDINTPIKPIMRPINVNNSGRRMLPSITTIWQA